MSSDPEAGIQDDPSIADEGLLYRRVFLQPRCITLDAATGTVLPHISTLQYRGDGLSVLLDDELVTHCTCPNEFCTESQTAFHFLTRVIRQIDGRVRRDPRPEQPYGYAHALAGTCAMPPDKQRWAQVRNVIIRSAQWLTEPNPKWSQTS